MSARRDFSFLKSCRFLWFGAREDSVEGGHPSRQGSSCAQSCIRHSPSSVLPPSPPGLCREVAEVIVGLGLNESILQLAAGKTFPNQAGGGPCRGSHPGAHSARTGADAWHWPFPQAGRGVGAAASCPLYPHGIPVLISWHLLPRSLAVQGCWPSSWGPG